MSTSPWWSENGGYFDEKYLCSPLYLSDLKTVVFQVDFIERILNPVKHTRILDVACGPGRTCLELAQRGYQNITGIDINSLFLEKARALAREAGTDIKFIQKDMRELAFSESFDIVLCVCTSIGYFDNDEENEAVIKNMVDALRPGGTLLIEVWKNIKDPQNWEEIWEDGTRVSLRIYINPITQHGELIIDRLVKGEKVPRHIEINYRIYQPEELEEMLTRFGLAPVIFYLDLRRWAETPIDDNRFSRIVVVARKPA